MGWVRSHAFEGSRQRGSKICTYWVLILLELRQSVPVVIHGSTMPVGEEMHDVLTLLAPILVCWLVVFFSGRRRYRLPPGPRGFPLIGNILDAPKENSHLVFQEWGRRFSTCLMICCLYSL